MICALLIGLVLGATPEQLQDVSVTIKAGEAQGSGSIVTRKIGNDSISFVWTAAHVINNLRVTRKTISPTGVKTTVEFKDPEVLQERKQDGRRVGEVKFTCKVVKFSDADYGEDLALLMVRCKNAYPLEVSMKFESKGYIPSIGTELSHCGSLMGQFGANSYTTGLVSQVGRTLEQKGANVQVFDQVTVTAFPGSSGGGVFLRDSGVYVGMLTQGVMKLQGFNFVVPVRRIHAWADKSGIAWALDDSPVPSLEEIEKIEVEDGGRAE